MSFIDRIAARMGYEKRAQDVSWQVLSASYGMSAGMSARAAENLSAVLACTTAIASALASIPALVYQRDAKGVRTEAPGHPLARLIRGGVNPHQSWPDFVEHYVSSALLSGNGLASQEYSPSGELAGLHYIPWHTVTASQLASGRLAYDVADGRGRVRRYLQGEVTHLRDRTDDGLIGRSRLSRAGSAVENAQAANDFSRNFLNNGAQPSGVLSTPGVIGPDALSRLREDFDRRHKGADNAGRVMILDGGLAWTPSQISPEDAELLETRKFGVEEICRIFQVPPPLVQDYSHNTFTNSETAGRWFAMFCLAPWARKIEAEFARSIFPVGGPYELEFDLSGFLRGDPATRWNAHAIALSNGVLTPDEVRLVEGWNPREAGGGGVA